MKRILVIEPAESVLQHLGNTLDELVLHPGVMQYLRNIAAQLNYGLVLLTSAHVNDKVEKFIVRTFKNEGIDFISTELKIEKGNEDAVYVTGGDAAKKFATENNLDFIDFNQLLANEKWKQVYHKLAGHHRKIIHSRITKETSVSIELNPDGEGRSEINTGLKFFDHMLEQIAKHGGLDLKITVKGDLEIDEHHTIEDTAITLGEAILKSLGNKRGIERYGFWLPMDDALAFAAIDFGGRSQLVWEANFNREYVGDMPTELFSHFFKSFCDAARCNLNIKVEGENEHHKIEAIFKAFAKAIKMAVKKDLNNLQLPSTKGTL